MKVMDEVNERNDGKSEIRFPLNQIYFYLTAGCNLACRHCWLSPKLQDENNTYPALSLELFKSILEQAKPLGLEAVKLTGGEPLMHPHIHEILKIVKEQDLSLVVETNGILCAPQLAEKMASCKKPIVSVSLDGADAETHETIRGIKGCFSAAVEGIKNLVNAGIKPQIIMTIMQRNKNQVEALAYLAESLGAGSIKFGIVNPIGRGENLSSGRETLTVEELLKLGQWIRDTLSRSTKLPLFFALPSAFRKMSEMYGPNGDGCATCGLFKMIGVLADGSYAICGIGTHISELVFGDAAIDCLEDVWNNHKILKALREGVPSRFEGICGNCHMKRACSALCIAQNYYRTGSLWKPYWFCEEAHKKGLFPASRILPKPFNYSVLAPNN